MKAEDEDRLIADHRRRLHKSGKKDCEATPEEMSELDRGFEEYLASEKAAGRPTRREDLL